MKKFGFCAALLAFLLLCGGNGARADSDGWVVFAKPNTHPDPVPILRINEFGKIFGRPFSFTDGDFLFTNWAHGLVGFDRASSYSCAFKVSEDGGAGGYSCAKPFTLSTIAKLVGFGEFIFGYDGVNVGQIVQYSVDPGTGAPVSRLTATLNLSSWTHIFATRNYVFFYNKSSGIYAVGTISDTGQFVQYANGTISSGYSFFARVGDTLVAYNAANGKYEVDAINFRGGTGAFAVTLVNQSSGVIGKGYSTVATLGNALVWHNGANGATLVGYLDQTPGNSGKWAQTSKVTGSAGYRYQAAAGNKIVFYNPTSGVAVADAISPTGTLVETDSIAVGAGYSDIGVTTR